MDLAVQIATTLASTLGYHTTTSGLKRSLKLAVNTLNHQFNQQQPHGQQHQQEQQQPHGQQHQQEQQQPHGQQHQQEQQQPHGQQRLHGQQHPHLERPLHLAQHRLLAVTKMVKRCLLLE